MINPYWELVILLVLVNIIFAQSLNIIIGYNGQFALGHAGFLAIGAYTSAVLAIQFKLPIVLSILSACLLTAVFGYLIGYPCLRLRGDYLAIATLGFAEIIRIVLLSLPAGIFGGPTGIRNAPNLKMFLPRLDFLNAPMNLLFTILFAVVSLFVLVWGLYALSGAVTKPLSGILWFSKRRTAVRYALFAVLLASLGLYSTTAGKTFLSIFQFHKAFSEESLKSVQWELFLVYLIVVAIVLVIFRNYINSSIGRAVIAIREDEIAASNLGIDIAKVKLMNFTFGSLFAGLAGALFAHTIPLFKPLDFNFFKSVDVLLMVVLGGMGTLSGATLGAAIITILPESLRFVGQWRLVIYALMLIFLMIFRPGGLLGASAAAEKVLRRLAPKPVPERDTQGVKG
mgnify:CR=1 FL=1